MATAASTTWIEKMPDVCGGRARVRTTRIAVWHLVDMRRHGSNGPDILANFPALTQDDLDTAWQYYADNSAEIDEDIRLNYEDA